MKKKEQIPVGLPDPLDKKKEAKEEKPITKNTEIKMGKDAAFKVGMRSILGEPTSKVLSIRFDPEDKYIAAACDNGEVQIYNVASQKLSYVLNATNQERKTPFSCVRWRPKTGSLQSKNILVTVNAEGEIQHWHMNTGKCLSTVKEDILNPQLYCIDYNNDASKFVVVGSDPALKIYDEETRKLELKLTGEGCSVPGHTSRIFCGKFDPDNPNVIVTGGWDQKILVWDVRDKTPVKSQFGPLICGDSIDIFEDVILTASWTQNNQLQQWDIGTMKCIGPEHPWDDGPKTSVDPTMLYAGQFSKNDGSLVLAGGSNANEARLFDRESLDRCACVIYDLSREVNTVDFGNKGDKFAIGGSDGYVRMFAISGGIIA